VRQEAERKIAYMQEEKRLIQEGKERADRIIQE